MPFVPDKQQSKGRFVPDSAPAEEAEPSFMDRVIDELKGLGRAGVQVAAAPADALGQAFAPVTDFPVAAYNLVTGKNAELPSAALTARLDQTVDFLAPKTGAALDKVAVRPMAAAAAGAVMNPYGPAIAALKPSVPANFRGAMTGFEEVAEKGANMGMKVNPANPNLNPTWGTKLTGWFSNTPKVNDTISRGNQPAFQRIVREGGELKAGEPLTREMMAAGRDRMGQIYTAVKQSGPMVVDEQIAAVQSDPAIARAIIKKLGRLDGADAADAVTAWQKLRDEASGAYKAIEGGVGNRTVLRESARTNEAAADALKAWIDRSLRAQGNVALADEFSTAPQRIAQSHTLTDAVIPAGKSVDPQVLANALENNVPLRGIPRSAAEFARLFPEAARSPIAPMGNSIGESSGAVGNLGAAVGSLSAGGSGAAMGASMTRGGSVPVVSHIANALLMRDALQRKVTGQPKMPGMTDELARLIAAFQAGDQ